MVETKKGLKTDGLREEIRECVKVFAEKLIVSLADNLKSMTVVGSSLTEDYKPSQSDVNTVLVLGKIDLGSLKELAGMAKSMGRKRLAGPVLMTETYIERSRDVFGIEFLDLQLTHRTILGDDPFEGLSFTKRDVRLQCERELKAALIRLRQGYIASAGRKRLVRDILISAASSLVPLLKAMLWLKDAARPGRSEMVFTKAAEEFSINMDSVIKARRWRHEKRRLSEGEIEVAFESIYGAIDKLAVEVDKLEV